MLHVVYGPSAEHGDGEGVHGVFRSRRAAEVHRRAQGAEVKPLGEPSDDVQGRSSGREVGAMQLEYYSRYERDVWDQVWLEVGPDVVEPLEPDADPKRVLDDAAQAVREGAVPGVPCWLRVVDDEGNIIAEREVIG